MFDWLIKHTYHRDQLNSLSKTLGNDVYNDYIWNARNKHSTVINEIRQLPKEISKNEIIAILTEND